MLATKIFPGNQYLDIEHLELKSQLTQPTKILENEVMLQSQRFHNIFTLLSRSQVVISFYMYQSLIVFYYLPFSICHLSNVVKTL